MANYYSTLAVSVCLAYALFTLSVTVLAYLIIILKTLMKRDSY